MSDLDLQGLLKTASARLRELQSQVDEQAEKIAEYEVMERVGEVVDRMIAKGHIASEDRHIKVAELMQTPDQLDVVDRAVDLATSGLNFNLSGSAGSGVSARDELEAFVLS